MDQVLERNVVDIKPIGKDFRVTVRF